MAVDPNIPPAPIPPVPKTNGPIVIYTSAAIGGFLTAIADLAQKSEASAVVKLTSVASTYLQLGIKPVIILLILTLLAMGLCLVFQPVDRKTAFATGAGVIAVIMTTIPFTQEPDGRPATTDSKEVGLVTTPRLLRLIDDTGTQGNAEPPQNGAGETATQSIFNLKARNTSSAPVTIGISVFAPETGQQFYQKNILGQNEEIIAPFAIDLPPGRTIHYKIEVNGRLLGEQQGILTAHGLDAAVSITDESIGSTNNMGEQGSPLQLKPQVLERNILIDKMFRTYHW